MALSAAMIYGGSQPRGRALRRGRGRRALRWLADAAGFPASAGGTFVSGGSIANLSALVAARGGDESAHDRRIIVAGASAHSSMAAAAHIMGCRLATAPAADAHGRLAGPVLEEALACLDPAEVVAVVATAGATNTGAFDALADVADVCAAHGLWLHVDGAYGGAALISPRTRPLLDGIERADSFIVDPHKMLYTPFDCAALVYRDCTAARRSLTQTADYLDPISDAATGNPSDLAVHLTRRVRGVPLWASVLAYGTDAYGAAVDHCVEVAGYAAARIAKAPALELVIEPAFTGSWCAGSAGRRTTTPRGAKKRSRAASPCSCRPVTPARRSSDSASSTRRRRTRTSTWCSRHSREAGALAARPTRARRRPAHAQRARGSQPITALTSRKSSSPNRPTRGLCPTP